MIAAPEFHAIPEVDATRSEAFILVHFAERLVVIGGTSYAGEIKKSVFTVMNYLLPLQGVLTMHASANVGPEGDTALFFGLSGTGKTTLSAEGGRALIGDDEHGWSDEGIFNFEGGCYAKVIRLIAGGRARDLRDHPALRHHPGERGHGPGHAAHRPRRRLPDREHPRRLPHRPPAQRGAPTGGAATPGTSSC